MAIAPAPTIDAAYTQALDFLTRVPLIDGHNDLPLVIRLSKQGKGSEVDSEVLHRLGQQ